MGRHDATCARCARCHLQMMQSSALQPRRTPTPDRAVSAAFGAAATRGKVIDQQGREVRQDALREQRNGPFGRVGFGHSTANPFDHLTRQQRLKRLEAVAKLLDIAFILPGTRIRYGVDGIIGLIPIVGTIIASALSLWLVAEARALGAPWHVTARMLGNIAIQGVAGPVPVVGDAFDVLFRANMRNARLLRRWLDREPR